MNLYLSDRCALSIAGLFILVLCSVSRAHEWHGRTDGSERFMHANLGVLADIPVYRWLSEGYNTFRIPGIVQSAKGTIITAAEGRVSTDTSPTWEMPAFATVSWPQDMMAAVWIKTSW